MTTIATMLGVEWDGAPSGPGYALNTHCVKQAAMKGMDLAGVLDAANNPAHTYPNGRYPGQVRHVKNGIVAVVDPIRRRVVTVYQDQVLTEQRCDQTDPDARRHFGKAK